MMDAAACVKSFLEANGAAASVQTETVFSYHADFGADSRISGCVVKLRVCGSQTEIGIVLPVSVQGLEYKGVADCIAALNEEIGREGCFDLDRLAGRIVYRTLVREADEDSLKCAVSAALETVAARSDGLMKMVCDESSAAQKRELKRIRQEERASRGDSLLMAMVKKYMAALKAKKDSMNAVECLPVPEQAEVIAPEEETEAAQAADMEEEAAYEADEPVCEPEETAEADEQEPETDEIPAEETEKAE